MAAVQDLVWRQWLRRQRPVRLWAGAGVDAWLSWLQIPVRFLRQPIPP